MISNLHTHTTLCDGKNTPEEMVQKAINLGLKSLGFSGHAPMPIENDWAMSYENFDVYTKEILRLREKYKKEIDIFLGIEKEHIFDLPECKFDYVLSSVHTIIKNNEVFYVDFTKKSLIDVVNKHYNGDFFALIEEYYEKVIGASKTGDILGHFDLITKFNKENDLFDEFSEKYQKIAKNALKACLDNDIIVEINTGAISRGYIDRFYPAPYLLDVLIENDAKIMITSDTHSAETIDFYYTQAVEILKKHGFKTHTILTTDGFVQVELV